MVRRHNAIILPFRASLPVLVILKWGWAIKLQESGPGYSSAFGLGPPQTLRGIDALGNRLLQRLEPTFLPFLLWVGYRQDLPLYYIGYVANADGIKFTQEVEDQHFRPAAATRWTDLRQIWHSWWHLGPLPVRTNISYHIIS